jgi:natural product precursor
MKKLYKTVLERLEGERLSKPELRHVVGGYEIDDEPSPSDLFLCRGREYNGQGICWKQVPHPDVPFSHTCVFSGRTRDGCNR